MCASEMYADDQSRRVGRRTSDRFGELDGGRNLASARFLFLELALVSSLAAGVARAAEPTAEEKETARAMMDAGHARREANDHERALAQFQGADAIMHVPTTGLEVAREQAALGLLNEARDTVRRVLRIPPAKDEPEAFRAARENARSLDDSLAKRIPALRIGVGGTMPDVPIHVTVDGTDIPVPALIAPFKVNPGHHILTATMAGNTIREEVDVTAGQTADAALNFAPPSNPAEAAPAPMRTDAVSAEENHPAPIAPWLRWGGLGLALAGTGVGSVAGVMSIAAANTAEKSCVNNQCPPGTWSDIRSSRESAILSTVSFAVAGVGVALGVASFFVRGSTTSARGTAVARPRLTTWIGAAGSGFGGTF
jgi:hypothetical protein